MKKSKWTATSAQINSLSDKQLKSLIKDIYDQVPASQQFIEARFSSPQDAKKSYKEIIEYAVIPPMTKNSKIDLRAGKKAISDYFKATNDALGRIDLMIFYVECGTQFTLEYGDVYESFYDSMVSVFAEAITKLQALGAKALKDHEPRLRKLVDDTKGMGWGYHDDLGDHYFEAFPSND